MSNTINFLKAGKIGFVLSAALLVLGAGCAVEGPRAQVYVAAPEVVAVDDYVYYPTYGIYYSGSRHQYAYLDGGAWVARPAPVGVSVNVLLASPSVRMDFHDSPANHHAEVSRQYPKTWAPARSGQKPGSREDHGSK